MGCFNTTCAMSNRQISYEDEIVSFIIVKSGRYNADDVGLTYPWDKFQIISMPLYGKYDDYGSITLDDTNSLAVKHLQEMFPEAAIVDEDHIDHDFLSEPQTDWRGDELSVGIMSLHRGTYEYAINKFVDKRWEDSFPKLMAYLREQLGTRFEFNDKNSKEEQREFMRKFNLTQIFNFRGDRDVIDPFGKDDPKDWHESSSLDSIVFIGVKHSLGDPFMYMQFDRYKFDSLDFDKFEAEFQHWNEVFWLMEAFETLGIQVVPSLYSSQESLFDEQMEFQLINMLVALNAKIKQHRRWDSYGDGDTNPEVIDLIIFRNEFSKLTEKFEEMVANNKDEDE